VSLGDLRERIRKFGHFVVVLWCSSLAPVTLLRMDRTIGVKKESANSNTSLDTDILKNLFFGNF
jgi:hypothetical protein